MKVNYADYTYCIIYSEEDSEFVALCAEFPSLSYIDKSCAVALAGIYKLVENVLQDMENCGEPIPQPMQYNAFA